MSYTLKLHIGTATIPSWLDLVTDSNGNIVYNVDAGDQITLPNYNMVNMEGHILAGWSETDTRVGTEFVFTKYYEPTESKQDLYPVWVQASQPARTITINPNIDTVTTVKEFSTLEGDEREAAVQAKNAFGSIVQDKVLEMPLIATMMEDIEDLQYISTTLETSVSGLETSVSGLETSVSGLETSVSGLETSVSGLDTRLDTVDEQISDIQNTVNGITTISSVISKCTFMLGTIVKECTVGIPDDNHEVYRYVIRLVDYRKRSADYMDTFGTNSDFSGSQISWYNNVSIVTDSTPVPNNSVLCGNAIEIGTLSYYALPVIESEESEDKLTIGTNEKTATNYGYTKVIKPQSGGNNLIFDSKKSYNNCIEQGIDSFGESVYLIAEPKEGCDFIGWYEVNNVGSIIDNGIPDGKIMNPVSVSKTYETTIDNEDVMYGALFTGNPTYPVCAARDFVDSNDTLSQGEDGNLGVLLRYHSENIQDDAKDMFVKDFSGTYAEGSSVSIPDSINEWDKLGVCTEYNKGEFYNVERDEQYNRMMLITKNTNDVKLYISPDNVDYATDWFTDYTNVNSELRNIEEPDELAAKFDGLLESVWPQSSIHGNRDDVLIYIFDQEKLLSSGSFNDSDFIVINITPPQE